VLLDEALLRLREQRPDRPGPGGDRRDLAAILVDAQFGRADRVIADGVELDLEPGRRLPGVLERRRIDGPELDRRVVRAIVNQASTEHEPAIEEGQVGGVVEPDLASLRLDVGGLERGPNLVLVRGTGRDLDLDRPDRRVDPDLTLQVVAGHRLPPRCGYCL
jgi:hypothetical protein